MFPASACSWLPYQSLPEVRSYFVEVEKELRAVYSAPEFCTVSGRQVKSVGSAPASSLLCWSGLVSYALLTAHQTPNWEILQHNVRFHTSSMFQLPWQKGHQLVEALDFWYVNKRAKHCKNSPYLKVRMLTVKVNILTSRCSYTLRWILGVYKRKDRHATYLF